jgi:hypothetical protein
MEAAFALRGSVCEGVLEKPWAVFCARYDVARSALRGDDEALALLHLLGTRAFVLRFDPSQEAWREFCVVYDALRGRVGARRW